MTIKDLQPQRLWKEFDAITQIPRPSKKEGKIMHIYKSSVRTTILKLVLMLQVMC